MSQTLKAMIAVVGIDIGKNSSTLLALISAARSFLRQKWSRGQVEARFANMPPCLIGMEACVGAHHLSRRLKALGGRPITPSLPPIATELLPPRNCWPVTATSVSTAARPTRTRGALPLLLQSLPNRCMAANCRFPFTANFGLRSHRTIRK
jgi:hypothetical protein